MSILGETKQSLILRVCAPSRALLRQSKKGKRCWFGWMHTTMLVLGRSQFKTVQNGGAYLWHARVWRWTRWRDMLITDRYRNLQAAYADPDSIPTGTNTNNNKRWPRNEERCTRCSPYSVFAKRGVAKIEPQQLGSHP